MSSLEAIRQRVRRKFYEYKNEDYPLTYLFPNFIDILEKESTLNNKSGLPDANPISSSNQGVYKRSDSVKDVPINDWNALLTMETPFEPEIDPSDNVSQSRFKNRFFIMLQQAIEKDMASLVYSTDGNSEKICYYCNSRYTDKTNLSLSCRRHLLKPKPNYDLMKHVLYENITQWSCCGKMFDEEKDNWLNHIRSTGCIVGVHAQKNEVYPEFDEIPSICEEDLIQPYLYASSVIVSKESIVQHNIFDEEKNGEELKKKIRLRRWDCF